MCYTLIGTLYPPPGAPPAGSKSRTAEKPGKPENTYRKQYTSPQRDLGSNPSTESNTNSIRKETDKYANAMQGIKAITERREPKDPNNSSTAIFDQRKDNQWPRQLVCSIMESAAGLAMETSKVKSAGSYQQVKRSARDEATSYKEVSSRKLLFTGRCYLEIAIAKRCRLHKLIRQCFALTLKIQQEDFALISSSRKIPAVSSHRKSRRKTSSRSDEPAAKQLTIYEELSKLDVNCLAQFKWRKRQEACKRKDANCHNDIPSTQIYQLLNGNTQFLRDRSTENSSWELRTPPALPYLCNSTESSNKLKGRSFTDPKKLGAKSDAYANRLHKGDVFAHLTSFKKTFENNIQTKRLSKRSPTLPLSLLSELPTVGNRRR
ncbi:DNA-directed RNA polymerase 3, chloroplastic [Dorcoceras hygrometricum]|uniref:DNA-directed RNA polymerase 3, chloroplastic n=1 Tax=Dorcoceras hygrometricum TaxID=472368 RepID=A0A2Z7BJ74_9LAMI|nr:DNA-directed RNA polymerase 3, chloroplastic [Dorcoceras hygrometricum]